MREKEREREACGGERNAEEKGGEEGECEEKSLLRRAI